MNRSRLKRLEERLNPKRDIELPIFLEVEGEDIIFTESILRNIGENPEDYEEHIGEPLSHSPTGRRVSRKASFIAEFTGEAWAPDCYLHLKGYEEQRIILL
jgi:hypothetical protein